MTQGAFPNKLKWANVTPILKGGDPTIISNYIPVITLSRISSMVGKTKSICNIFNKKRQVQVCCYDSIYGFSSIYHTTLIKKLQYYGEKSVLMSVLESYLSDRE